MIQVGSIDLDDAGYPERGLLYHATVFPKLIELTFEQRVNERSRPFFDIKQPIDEHHRLPTDRNRAADPNREYVIEYVIGRMMRFTAAKKGTVYWTIYIGRPGGDDFVFRGYVDRRSPHLLNIIHNREDETRALNYEARTRAARLLDAWKQSEASNGLEGRFPYHETSLGLQLEHMTAMLIEMGRRMFGGDRVPATPPAPAASAQKPPLRRRDGAERSLISDEAKRKLEDF